MTIAVSVCVVMVRRMTEEEATAILHKAAANHLRTCGTKYRGCDPACPKEQAEKLLALRSKDRIAAAKDAIAALTYEEWEQARPRMCHGCFDRLAEGERCYCLDD